MTRDKTTQQIAELLDLDTTTIQKWLLKGLPCDRSKGHAKPHMFNSSEVAAWMLEHKKTGKAGRPTTPMSSEREALEIRKLQLQVAKGEREAKIADGLLIDAAEEQRRDIANITTIRNKLSGLGASIAPQLEGMSGAERQDLIDGAVNGILEQLGEKK